MGTVTRNILRYSTYKQDLKIKNEELACLVIEAQGYRDILSSLESKEFWVLEAKKKLGYIQPGEVVYKFYKKEAYD